MGASSEAKAKRRAARERVGACHEAPLADCDHIREALARFDAGELDAFEVDEVIHRYTRASRADRELLADEPAAGSTRSPRGRCARPGSARAMSRS